MENLYNIIKAHAARYPLMAPRDAVKLLYQARFGGGHMIPDPQMAYTRLAAEYAETPKTDDLFCEDIGGGMMRLYLGGIPETALRSVSALFVMGANSVKGDMGAFLNDLNALETAAQDGLFPFSSAALAEYLDGYRAAGCPMVSHTDTYRNAYTPAYRVMPALYRPFLPLIFELDRRLAAGERTVLAIDGQCGSGKSTLAGVLKELYDPAVIQMDDFFLPPALRTAERLGEAGGNIHYERFFEEIVSHIGKGSFSYTAFDCGVMDMGGSVAVPDRPLTVVEGSYCLHPRFGKYYDLSVYTRCPMDVRLDRLRRRCDDSWLMQRFENEWIPMETQYCAVFGIDTGADMVIDT